MFSSTRARQMTVAVSVFVLFGLLDGIRLSFGVLLLDWTSSFSAGRAEVAWIGAIVYGVSNLAGSWSSTVIRRTDCHVAIALGSTLIASGLFISSFATNVTFLYFSYGILLGFGYSIAYLAGMVLVTRYFLTRLSLALGLTACGGGIGVFLLNPAVRFLNDRYGWRGALWILSAVLLNGVLIGCINKAVASGRSIPKHNCYTGSDLQSDNSFSEDTFETIAKREDHNITETANSLGNNYSGNLRSVDITDSKTEDEIFPFLGEDREANNRENVHTNEDKYTQPLCNGQDIKIANLLLKPPPVIIEVNGFICSEKRHECSVISGSNGSFSLVKTVDTPRKGLAQKPISCNSLPTSDLKQNKCSFTHATDMHGRILDSSPQYEKHRFSRKKNFNLPSAVRSFVIISLATSKRILWPSHVLKNRRVCIFLLSSFIRSFPFFIPITYLPDIVVNAGFSPLHASWVASICGITSTACLIFIGWFADLRCVNRIMLFSACTIISGLLTSICYIYTSLELLITYAVIFSFFFSGHVVLTSVVVADICSTRMFPDALGYQWTIMGIGTMIGTPLAGLVFDVKQNYDVAFAVSGAIIAISGVVAGSLVCFAPVSELRTLEVTDKDADKP